MPSLSRYGRARIEVEINAIAINEVRKIVDPSVPTESFKNEIGPSF